MKWSIRDHEYMALAMQLARQGLYSCQPNPRVGCVIVQDDKVVGTGSHIQAGKEHAEIIALQQAGVNSKEGICYVTLEPCVHIGKTPPCTDALINAGLKTVYAAMVDPNPRVNGRGLAKLIQNGLITHSGLLENEAASLNKGFLKRMKLNMPYVRCKMAVSLDGKTALSSGISKWITSDVARKDVQRLRAKSCAILTGIGTVLMDDPMLTVRDIDTCGRQPIRVIIDRKLQIPTDSKVLQQTGSVIIFTNTNDNKKVQLLNRKGVEIINIGEDQRFLLSCLECLASDYEINEVLVEAGARLSGALLEAGMLDELVMYQAPVILGDKAASLFSVSEIESMSEKYCLSLVDIRHIGENLRMIYEFKK